MFKLGELMKVCQPYWEGACVVHEHVKRKMDDKFGKGEGGG